MGIPFERQLSALLYAALSGILCGAIYDLIRIFRVLLGLSTYTKAGRALHTVPLPWIGPARKRRQNSVSHIWRGILIALGDLIFAICAGCVFSIFLYHAASGEFRWFYLFMTCIGFVVYYFSLGRVVMFSSEAIAFVLHTVFRYVICLICLPFRLGAWLGRRLLAFLQRVFWKPLHAAVHYRSLVRYTDKMQKQLLSVVFISEKRSE